MLRQSALQHLEVLSSRAEFHGQPPALMLSFEGLESSLLLASDFWRRLEGAVPGELVVGVPARDVVIVTGSQSGPGLEKAKRCVERVFFAGGENLVSRGLLVRRGGSWEPFDRSARPSGRPTFGPAHLHGVGQPPRQFQEHPSWPGERVPPLQPAGAGPRMGPRHAPVRRRPMYPMAPAAGLESTGFQHVSMTGSQASISAMTGQMIPAARQPESAYRDYAAEVAEAAQYSAVPYSAMPYSASPYSIAPQSVAPNGVAIHGLVGSPATIAPYSSVPYQQDTYSTGNLPRAAYPDYEAVAAERSMPSYPGSWGSAPDIAPARPEFRSGPRARFS
jgi:hypothetical protein